MKLDATAVVSKHPQHDICAAPCMQALIWKTCCRAEVCTSASAHGGCGQAVLRALAGLRKEKGWLDQADRAGLAGAFAAAYEGSALAAGNAAALERDMAERHVSAAISKELATSRATTTPFWWGVKTILKVRARAAQ